MRSDNRFTCVDLFSGAGGLSRGFLDAGYNVVLGVDHNESALKTFKENHGNAETMLLDLFDHSNIDVIVNYLKERDISVDVLSRPHKATKEELDPKKYGVIVIQGHKKGLLLPDLEGVDSVDYQLEIACEKAGISPLEEYEIERFEVKRYKEEE